MNNGELDNERIHILTQSALALIMVLGGGLAYIFLQVSGYDGGDALIGLIGSVSSYYFLNAAIRQSVSTTQRVQREANAMAQTAANGRERH